MADLSNWDPIAVERYRGILKKYVTTLRMNPRIRVRLDESDVVQETLTRAVQSGCPFQEEDDNRRLAWLFAIAKTVICDASRTHLSQGRDVDREQRQLTQTLEDSTAEYLLVLSGKELSPHDQVLLNEKQSLLEAAIRQLPEKQRDVVWRIVTEHKSYAEAATELGITEGAVAGLYRRGIKTVCEKLGDSPES
jgi:RNA polymerase sigma-70 factor, ECF subfamily